MSTFIIRMFLVSAQVNQNAYYRDHAAAYAMRIVETFKENPYGEAMRQLMQLDAAADEPACVIYYDKSWQPVAAGHAVYAMEAAYQLPPSQVNALPLTPGGDHVIRQGFVSVHVTIWQVEQGQMQNVLVSYQTGRYTRLPAEEPS
jgi:hypothetical protein